MWILTVLPEYMHVAHTAQAHTAKAAWQDLLLHPRPLQHSHSVQLCSFNDTQSIVSNTLISWKGNNLLQQVGSCNSPTGYTDFRNKWQCPLIIIICVQLPLLERAWHMVLLHCVTSKLTFANLAANEGSKHQTTGLDNTVGIITPVCTLVAPLP